MLFMLYKVVLTFETVDKVLKWKVCSGTFLWYCLLCLWMKSVNYKLLIIVLTWCFLLWGTIWFQLLRLWMAFLRFVPSPSETELVSCIVLSCLLCCTWSLYWLLSRSTIFFSKIFKSLAIQKLILRNAEKLICRGILIFSDY